MTRLLRSAAAAAIALALATVGHPLTDATAGPPVTREERTLARQERQLRQGQGIVRRLLRNPRVSPEVRQQAVELQTALEARERAMQRLENLHRDFLARHQADLAELENLRKRAFEIDQKLSAERAAVLQANESEVAELSRQSERAIELLRQLRGARTRERPQ